MNLTASSVALITGAASGIGRHWAGVLARHPARPRLVLTDINAAGLRAAFAESERELLRALDIRDPEQWRGVLDETLARFGRLDYLFNIAGGGRPAFLIDQPLEDIAFALDLNLKGPLLGLKLAGEIMVRQGAGHIVNVASLAALTPTPGNALYSAAKAGLRQASLAAAIELRRRGVAVTVISPDLVDTPLMRANLSRGEAAALAYSGSGPLSVADVERALWRAVRGRPLEITLPRWRGWLARLTNLNPALMLMLYEPLRRRGLQRLEAERRRLNEEP